MMRRRFLPIGGVAALVAACGSAPAPTPSGSASASVGQPAALVQIENDAAARPQGGLSKAAVVYEYLTEGGISRFSALFTTPPSARRIAADPIGPVRSARLVTVHLAEVYGAVIVYSGASTAVQKALDRSHAPHVDENAAHGNLFRVDDRKPPHNLVTDGDHLSDLLSRYHATVTLPPDVWARTSSPPTSGKAVSRFTVPISDSEQPAFMWDAALHAWTRSEADTGPFLDATSRQPVAVATVIVQQVSRPQTGDIEDVNGAYGLDHVITGSGRAQVFTAGREYDAGWSQGSTGPPRFTLSGGSAAPIAPGLVWVCLVAAGPAAAAS